MEKLTKALMTDETGQEIVTKLTALSGQMHELAMATRGSAILFESASDISVLGDGGYLAVYVGTTNPLVISGWTGDNSLVTGHLYYLIKSGTAVTSRDLGEYGGTAVTDPTLSISGAPADAKAVGDALAEKADADDVTAIDDRVTALESGSSGGLTADIKSALLACFAHVAWASDDGQTYYDALDAALNPPANLSSITCVYTQSGTVYDTASLDDLKTDLVVTAHWSDNTTSTVTTYTLSGTLTEGTSTITVSYGGKTTTFTVTVTSLMETITVTWSGSGADSTTQVIDATSSELYWRLPYMQDATQYASGATRESVFVKIETVLFHDANKENLAGFYYIDTGEIKSSGRITANRPSMPVDTLTKVAPSGYYAVIKVSKRAGFTDNASCRSFLNTYATDAQLAHVGE